MGDDVRQTTVIVVGKRCASASRVGNRLNRVVCVVGPRSSRSGILLGHVLRFQVPVAVVSKGRVLVGAAAFSARILPDLRYLIESVVAVNGCRVNAAALPVEDLCLQCAAEYV